MPGLGNTIALSQTGQFGSLNVTNTAQTTVTNGNTQTTTTTSTPPVVAYQRFPESLYCAIGCEYRRGHQSPSTEELAADPGRPNLICREW